MRPFFFASLCCLRHAVLGDWQAENRCAVLLCQREKFFDTFLLGADRIDEGSSRISSESCFKRFGITGINRERGIGDLCYFSNGIMHRLRLIDAADAHVDIEETSACAHLVDGLALDGEE